MRYLYDMPVPMSSLKTGVFLSASEIVYLECLTFSFSFIFPIVCTTVFAPDVLDMKRYLSMPSLLETEFFVVEGLTVTFFTYSKSAFYEVPLSLAVFKLFFFLRCIKVRVCEFCVEFCEV